MRVGNFSVLIPEGREYETGHVGLAHGKQYGLKIGNHYHLETDAEVVVDGQPVDTFRLRPHETLTIEGPPKDPARGRFTFHKADSVEGQIGGSGEIAKPDRGVIKVTFRPAKAPPVIPRSARDILYTHMDAGTFETSYNDSSGGSPRSFSKGGPRGQGQNMRLCSVKPPTNAEAGITTLTGHTDQKWVECRPIEYDPDGTVVINIRLVAVDPTEAVRPLAAAVKRAPVGNAVPPPVGS